MSIEPPRDQAEPVLPTPMRRRASDTETPADWLPRCAIRPNPDELGVLGLEPTQPAKRLLHAADAIPMPSRRDGAFQAASAASRPEPAAGIARGNRDVAVAPVSLPLHEPSSIKRWSKPRTPVGLRSPPGLLALRLDALHACLEDAKVVEHVCAESLYLDDRQLASATALAIGRLSASHGS